MHPWGCIEFLADWRIGAHWKFYPSPNVALLRGVITRGGGRGDINVHQTADAVSPGRGLDKYHKLIATCLRGVRVARADLPAVPKLERGV